MEALYHGVRHAAVAEVGHGYILPVGGAVEIVLEVLESESVDCDEGFALALLGALFVA